MGVPENKWHGRNTHRWLTGYQGKVTLILRVIIMRMRMMIDNKSNSKENARCALWDLVDESIDGQGN